MPTTTIYGRTWQINRASRRLSKKDGRLGRSIQSEGGEKTVASGLSPLNRGDGRLDHVHGRDPIRRVWHHGFP